MIKRVINFLFFILSTISIHGQTSDLFNDKIINEIHILIPKDTLLKIYDNPLSEIYSSATFLFDKDSISDVGFRLRGNSSRYSKKKSFKISFNEFVAGRKYQGVKKLNLNGEHNDPSLIREKLFYDNWNKVGMPERRTSFVKLYINNEYYGLYTLLEEYDKEWLDRVFGEKKGNLYKCTYPADLKYIDDQQSTYKKLYNTTTTGGRVYDLKTNETEDDYSDLVRFIRIANMPVNQSFIDSIYTVLDVNGLLKAYAMDVSFGNWDDFFYNKNNFFLYHGADDRFKFITYDTDNSAGIDFLNKDWATRNCLSWYNSSIPLTSKLLSIKNNNILFAKYLDTIARNFIAPTIIFPKIDSMKNLIITAALSDTYRKLDYGFDDNDFDNSFVNKVISFAPYGVKPFFETRYYKILEQNSVLLALDPGFAVENSTIKLFPNPINDKLFFQTEEKIKSIIFYNEEGKIIKTFKNIEENKLDLSNLKSGLYIIKILYMNNKMSIQRVIKN